MSASLDVPLLHAYQPTTFLERGVAVPFTTPLLAGTRARPAERGGTELLIPNPSGGAGVYILPWSDLRAFCRPTLHDIQLNERIAEARAITPADIRRAAQEIAAEGLAGRAARQQAQAAAAKASDERLLTNFLLLLELVRQNEASGTGLPPPERASPAELELRARRQITRLAPALGCNVEQIAVYLEQLAERYAGIGVGAQTAQARHGRTMSLIARMREEALDWAARQDDTAKAQAALLADTAALTLACGERILADCRGRTADIRQLLRSWHVDPDKLTQTCTRPDWLLDGWDQICLLWTTAADDAERRLALADIALMIPVIPREVCGWIDSQIDVDTSYRFRKNILLNHDWRSGMLVLLLTARNEQIRALAE